jgi:hypothetical protein
MRRIFGTYAVSVVPRALEIWPCKTVQGLMGHPVYCVERKPTQCKTLIKWLIIAGTD